jgi:hypothetical protein
MERALGRMPPLAGRPVVLRALPDLRAHRGRLLSGGSRGREVHAASFLRKREIVLDSALGARPCELARILVHELFHFAWLRAGNPVRRSWEALLAAEMRRRARGELGWSAESEKTSLAPADVRNRSRRWREYACESFADTAAWMFAGLRTHAEFTLARRFRSERRAWFRKTFGETGISI